MTGDLNARVGNDYQAWRVVRMHGLANSNGQQLLEMRATNDLVSTASAYQKQDVMDATSLQVLVLASTNMSPRNETDRT